MNSSVCLNSCTFSGNYAFSGSGGAGGGAVGTGYGGGIFAIAPAVTQSNSTYVGNIASTGGPNFYVYTQPSLSVTQVNGGLHFSWPIDLTGNQIQYLVQYRSLAPPPVWHFLNASITNNGTAYGCDAPPGSDPSGTCYRLTYSPH